MLLLVGVTTLSLGSGKECVRATDGPLATEAAPGGAGSAEEEGVPGCMQQLRSALWDLTPFQVQPQLPAAPVQGAAGPGSPAEQHAGGATAQAGGAGAAAAPGLQAGALAAPAACASAEAAAATAAEDDDGEANAAEEQPQRTAERAGRNPAAFVCQLLGAALLAGCLPQSAGACWSEPRGAVHALLCARCGRLAPGEQFQSV